MPLIGPILFILGIINIYKKNKKIFFTIFLYLFLFNFYFSGNTGQHIQTLFIMIFAFSINELINLLKSETLFKYVLFTKIVILILFTYNFNLKIYNEENYPYKFEKLFFSKSKWPQNLVRPLNEIVLNLREISKKDKPILNLIDGSISMYHGRDLNWIYKNDLEKFNLLKKKCFIFDFEKYSAIVISKKSISVCEDKNLEFIEFENSYLYIVK